MVKTTNHFGSEIYLGSNSKEVGIYPDIVSVDFLHIRAIILELKFGLKEDALACANEMLYPEKFKGKFDTIVIGMNFTIDREVILKHEVHYMEK